MHLCSWCSALHILMMLIIMFSVSQLIDELLASCTQPLFALRTLRQHGLPTEALRAVFLAHYCK